VSGLTRSDVTGSLVVALLALGALLLRPVAAEAQARGTLQVTAQVVDVKISSQGLQAARAALFAPATSSGAATSAPVSTLAHVSVAYPSAERAGIVVTIDYSKD
jgi:hypothetical protein